jgi:cbb3-type cytochrome oxidase maturation protein
MTILHVLIPLSVLLMAGATWALMWAIDAGQFDDLEEVEKSVFDNDD